jgi:hypothetical protein
VIWFDETEGGNTTAFTLPEIVISRLAKGNAFNSTIPYTHSSDLRTLEELFGVDAPGGGFLGDANTPGTNDLSNLCVPGALSAVPEPSTWAMILLGFAGLGYAGYRGRRSVVAAAV